MIKLQIDLLDMKPFKNRPLVEVLRTKNGVLQIRLGEEGSTKYGKVIKLKQP